MKPDRDYEPEKPPNPLDDYVDDLSQEMHMYDGIRTAAPTRKRARTVAPADRRYWERLALLAKQYPNDELIHDLVRMEIGQYEPEDAVEDPRYFMPKILRDVLLPKEKEEI